MKRIARASRLLVLVFCVIMAVSGCAGVEKQKTYISMATGGTGGSYYPIGTAMAELQKKYIENIEVTVEVTGSSNENCRLVGTNESQFAQANAHSVYYAYEGIDAFKGEKLDTLRACFNMHPSFLQFVARTDSGITSINDFVGKRVCLGNPGGGGYIAGEMILKAAGITEADYTASYMTFSEQVAALNDGLIDVMSVYSSVPASSILEMANTRDVTLISIDMDLINKVCSEVNFFFPTVIPGGTYKGTDADANSIKGWNVVICPAELDEELVYQSTKIWFENIDYLTQIHPICGYMNPEDAVEVPIPMHPGAERYFKEVGSISN